MVAPVTVSEPPETFSALAPVSIVRVLMVSVPVLCDTAKPPLSTTSLVLVGTNPELQLPAFSQFRPLAALVKVTVPEVV